MRGHAAVGFAVALLALAGCQSRKPAAGPSADASPARDKGPLCVGTAAAGMPHVLRGGGFTLPGGGGVRYTGASADGTTRTATLADGARYRSGARQWTVRTGARLTVSGHAYTVRQICSYRVVLAPDDAEARAALAAEPASTRSSGGSADDGLCYTTNRSALTAAGRGFPAEGQALPLVTNGGRRQFPTGWSIAVYFVSSADGTAHLGASCAGIPAADYQDVATGDTVEFAGTLFRATVVGASRSVTLTRLRS
ncbi:hypothetical protein AB0C59_01465 [Streptomyces sp. NPDC048664]|uniref:hypothetical protein n=1 Tax=Streptomyces sp. NPDC048664 TaxID=3154505 RepID=UPI003434B39A